MITLNSITRIASPPYLLRPTQIVNRIWRELAWRSSTRAVVRLPWGLDIVVNPHEAIGYNLATRGIYDLAVTEALWRLTDRGELAADVGANIGYTASLLGIRVGRRGRVLCFEPHPDVFRCLRENVEAWQRHGNCGSFVLYEAAVGRANGKAILKTDACFNENRGTARIVDVPDSGSGSCIEVRMAALDGVLNGGEKIGVLKLDAEGAELNVLTGMSRLLGQGCVRDIVFEEKGGFPAPTHKFLQSLGYTVTGLEPRLFGLRCSSDAAPSYSPGGDPPNYLASMDPKRAMRRLGQPLWRSFGMLSLIPGRS